MTEAEDFRSRVGTNVENMNLPPEYIAKLRSPSTGPIWRSEQRMAEWLDKWDDASPPAGSPEEVRAVLEEIVRGMVDESPTPVVFGHGQDPSHPTAVCSYSFYLDGLGPCAMASDGKSGFTPRDLISSIKTYIRSVVRTATAKNDDMNGIGPWEHIAFQGYGEDTAGENISWCNEKIVRDAGGSPGPRRCPACERAKRIHGLRPSNQPAAVEAKRVQSAVARLKRLDGMMAQYGATDGIYCALATLAQGLDMATTKEIGPALYAFWMKRRAKERGDYPEDVDRRKAEFGTLTVEQRDAVCKEIRAEMEEDCQPRDGETT